MLFTVLIINSYNDVHFTNVGKEQELQPLGEEFGTTVYGYYPKCDIKFIAKSWIEGAKFKSPIPKDIDPDSLRFESRFESGNLMKAVRVTEKYYELYLRPDLYTTRHCQWFYFRVENMRNDVEYTFSIVNFTKPDSQYSVGMKPVLYSVKETERSGVGWTRAGDQVRYYRDHSTPRDAPRRFIMSFSVRFPHSKDTVYLAHCYPYRSAREVINYTGCGVKREVSCKIKYLK